MDFHKVDNLHRGSTANTTVTKARREVTKKVMLQNFTQIDRFEIRDLFSSLRDLRVRLSPAFSTMCFAYDKHSNDILDLSRACLLVFSPEEIMAKGAVVKHGDVSQRVGVEVIRARGVDVEKLIKMLIANAAAEFASTYYYYTILRMHLAGHEDYKEICEDARLEDRGHWELIVQRT